MTKACVIGHPVAHSRSPMIHGYWLRTLGIAGAYELKDVEPADFVPFITDLPRHGYVGANVTLPYKEAAYKAVAVRDDAAQAVGAVNTLWLEDGRLVGGNSDVQGFMANLDERVPGWCVPGCKALILGAGGAARAAVYAFKQRGAEVQVINRTVSRAREVAQQLGARASGWETLPQLLPQADVLVNCTALGMQGKEPLEIDLSSLKKSAVVYDIIYVPLETELLRQARSRGHRTVDGLGMLLHQAALGFRKWFGGDPKVTPQLRRIVEADVSARA